MPTTFTIINGTFCRNSVLILRLCLLLWLYLYTNFVKFILVYIWLDLTDYYKGKAIYNEFMSTIGTNLHTTGICSIQNQFIQQEVMAQFTFSKLPNASSWTCHQQPLVPLSNSISFAAVLLPLFFPHKTGKYGYLYTSLTSFS